MHKVKRSFETIEVGKTKTNTGTKLRIQGYNKGKTFVGKQKREKLHGIGRNKLHIRIDENEEGQEEGENWRKTGTKD